jgi:hypothetical protein
MDATPYLEVFMPHVAPSQSGSWIGLARVDGVHAALAGRSGAGPDALGLVVGIGNQQVPTQC